MDTFLRDSTSSVSTSEPRMMEHIFSNPPHKNDKSLNPIHLNNTTDDELFLLIDNKGSSRDGRSSQPSSNIKHGTDDDLDSGVHVEYRQYVLNKKLNENKQLQSIRNAVKLQPTSETPKRKSRNRYDVDQLRLNSLNRKLLSPILSTTPMWNRKNYQKESFPTSEIYYDTKRFDVIRSEIATRMDDMNQLLQYEKDVMVTLSERCAQYRAQNEKYNSGKNGLVMCIEEVQAKLDTYAKEIVENEFELFKIKLEITQKCGILHNLQRMLKMEEELSVNRNESVNGSQMSTIKKKINNKIESTEVNFVDNIFEFCDNNKSILV